MPPDRDNMRLFHLAVKGHKSLIINTIAFPLMPPIGGKFKQIPDKGCPQIVALLDLPDKRFMTEGLIFLRMPVAVRLGPLLLNEC